MRNKCERSCEQEETVCVYRGQLKRGNTHGEFREETPAIIFNRTFLHHLQTYNSYTHTHITIHEQTEMYIHIRASHTHGRSLCSLFLLFTHIYILYLSFVCSLSISPSRFTPLHTPSRPRSSRPLFCQPAASHTCIHSHVHICMCVNIYMLHFSLSHSFISSYTHKYIHTYTLSFSLWYFG